MELLRTKSCDSQSDRKTSTQKEYILFLRTVNVTLRTKGCHSF